MTATTERIQAAYSPDTHHYREQVQALCMHVTTRFRRVLFMNMLFHLTFISALVIEILAFVAWLPHFVASARVALGLASIFMTAFSYSGLRLYLQAKKPLQFEKLCQVFIAASKRLIHYREGMPDHHLALASAATKLAIRLEGEELRCYAPRRRLKALAPSLEKVGIWVHWRDVLAFRERLFQQAITEHIKLIQCEPTNTEAHAVLANAYVLLSGLYLAQRLRAEGWKPSPRISQELHDQFRQTAQRAIEEFKILNTYAPDDPWVHAQLAYSYRDLQMPEEEIREYEIILQLRPNDLDTLFKLGMRYFESGQTAKGLAVYAELKERRYRGADELIASYQ